MAAAQAAHLSGHHGSGAAFLCGEHLHLFHRAPAGERASHRRERYGSRPRSLYGPRSAGLGTDRDRHQLCDHGAVSGSASGLARPDGNGPCGRKGAGEMMSAPSHLIIAPILIPLLAGALLLFFEDRERRLKDAVSILTSAALVVVAAVLLFRTGADGGRIFVYLLGNWPSPIAINLVLDRLSAMMLLLTAVLALPALVFSIARWQRAGAHFHSLFLFLLVGLNGAFLTGDLFNLFVFFEVLLAASYGLMLHGSGQLRVRAGMHYIVINLAASLLFLIGVAMIYSVTGTLNMARLALVLQGLEGESRFMADAGAGILGIAFLVKAGSWPLNIRLPTAYSAAA